MCKYCERRKDVPFGWEQPKLPYHSSEQPAQNLSGNIADFSKFEGHIFDYKTTVPQLVLTGNGYFSGDGVGTVYIPIKYCPECGRKLGENKGQEENIQKLQTWKREGIGIPVSDDWFGNYPGNTIHVYISLSYHSPKWMVRIGAWGNDDYGLTKSWYFRSYEDALRKFEKICPSFFYQIPSPATKQWFLRKGFKQF